MAVITAGTGMRATSGPASNGPAAWPMSRKLFAEPTAPLVCPAHANLLTWKYSDWARAAKPMPARVAAGSAPRPPLPPHRRGSPAGGGRPAARAWYHCGWMLYEPPRGYVQHPHERRRSLWSAAFVVSAGRAGCRGPSRNPAAASRFHRPCMTKMRRDAARTWRRTVHPFCGRLGLWSESVRLDRLDLADHGNCDVNVGERSTESGGSPSVPPTLTQSARSDAGVRPCPMTFGEIELAGLGRDGPIGTVVDDDGPQRSNG